MGDAEDNKRVRRAKQGLTEEQLQEIREVHPAPPARADPWRFLIRVAQPGASYLLSCLSTILKFCLRERAQKLLGTPR